MSTDYLRQLVLLIPPFMPEMSERDRLHAESLMDAVLRREINHANRIERDLAINLTSFLRGGSFRHDAVFRTLLRKVDRVSFLQVRGIETVEVMSYYIGMCSSFGVPHELRRPQSSQLLWELEQSIEKAL